jgi:hypothetical protein
MRETKCLPLFEGSYTMKIWIVTVCICFLAFGCGGGKAVKTAQKEKTKKVIYNAKNEMKSYYTYEYNIYEKEGKCTMLRQAS